MDSIEFSARFLSSKPTDNRKDELIKYFDSIMVLYRGVSNAHIKDGYWFEIKNDQPVLNIRFSNKSKINDFLSYIKSREALFIYGIEYELYAAVSNNTVSIEAVQCL